MNHNLQSSLFTFYCPTGPRELKVCSHSIVPLYAAVHVKLLKDRLPLKCASIYGHESHDQW